MGGLRPHEFQVAVFEMDLADLLIWIRTSNLFYQQREIDREAQDALKNIKPLF